MLAALHEEEKLKRIKEILKTGLSKEEAFQQAAEENLDLIKVARHLASFADQKEIEENKLLHRIFVGILVLNVLINAPYFFELLAQINSLAVIIPLIVIALPIWIIYSVFRGQAIGFYIYAFFTVRGLPSNFEGYEGNEFSSWILFSLWLMLLVYSVYLKNKLLPYQNYFNTKKDEDGYSVYR